MFEDVLMMFADAFASGGVVMFVVFIVMTIGLDVLILSPFQIFALAFLLAPAIILVYLVCFHILLALVYLVLFLYIHTYTATSPIHGFLYFLFCSFMEFLEEA